MVGGAWRRNVMGILSLDIFSKAAAGKCGKMVMDDFYVLGLLCSIEQNGTVAISPQLNRWEEVFSVKVM
jgi:hypothetical protein